MTSSFRRMKSHHVAVPVSGRGSFIASPSSIVLILRLAILERMLLYGIFFVNQNDVRDFATVDVEDSVEFPLHFRLFVDLMVLLVVVLVSGPRHLVFKAGQVQ